MLVSVTVLYYTGFSFPSWSNPSFLSAWSAASVKQHWQTHVDLMRQKISSFVVFFKAPHMLVEACIQDLFLYICLLDFSSIFKSYVLSCIYFNSVTVPFNPCGIWNLWERNGKKMITRKIHWLIYRFLQGFHGTGHAETLIRHFAFVCQQL